MENKFKNMQAKRIASVSTATPRLPTDINNNVEIRDARDPGSNNNTTQQRCSSLCFFPSTVNDLMNGNFNIQVQESIGKGYGGNVYRCELFHDYLPNPTGSKTLRKSSVVALKILPKEKTKARAAVNEVNLLQAAEAPNVLAFMLSVETLDSYWIVTEFCSQGDLHGKLQDLDVQDILTRDYMRDVISGLQCLHSKLIAHSDIKMKNILITDKNVAKIADFGFARQYSRPTDMEATCNGTKDYWAPEMLRAPTFNPFLADIYALGVTFVGVCERRPIKLKYDNIHEIVKRFREKHQLALFQGLLATHTERWSLQTARNNLWLREYESAPNSPV